MPNSYDRGRLEITHPPNQRIDTARSKQAPPVFGGDQNALLDGALTDLTGIFDITAFWNGLLSFFRPVPQIQAASVVDTNPNLILQPTFSAAAALVAPHGQGWTWDSGAGRDSVGSAKVVAAGYLTELLSNQILVVEGQKLDLSVWVKWDSIVYTGTAPIVLGVTRYLKGAEIGGDDLASFTSPVTTHDWTQLGYNGYTVPAGCDEIRLRFTVPASMSAGTVWFDDASVTKTQPGSGFLGAVIDQGVNGLENTNATGWDLGQWFASMFNQFATTTDHATRITLLEALASTGNKINDEFLRVGTTLGANWHVTYSGPGAGTWETDGDMLFWNASGIANRSTLARYIGTVSTTATDKQKIVGVLGSKGEVDLLFGLAFIDEGHLDLYGRMNTAETDWIRARFSARGAVTITRSISGTLTDLAHVDGYDAASNPTGPQPAGAGSTIALLCGTTTGTRFFEAQLNGATICSTSDSTSSVGTAYRGYGAGCLAEGSLLSLKQGRPAKLNAWAAVDN